MALKYKHSFQAALSTATATANANATATESWTRIVNIVYWMWDGMAWVWASEMLGEHGRGCGCI